MNKRQRKKKQQDKTNIERVIKTCKRLPGLDKMNRDLASYVNPTVDQAIEMLTDAMRFELKHFNAMLETSFKVMAKMNKTT